MLALAFVKFPIHAAEWVGAAGDFSVPANWAGGAVPGAETVNILNGGSANILTPGSFEIGALMLGGHAGQGGIIQSGGCLTTQRIILGGDDANGGTGTGSYTITDGALYSLANEIWIGSKGGEGSLELAGNSLVSSASWIVVGRDGASGHLGLSDTSMLEVKSSNLPVGCNSNGFTSTMAVRDSARISVAGEIWVGWLGNHSNHGIMTVTDKGLVSTGAGLVIGRNGARGTLVATGNGVINASGYLMCGADPGGLGELTLSDDAHVHAGKPVWLGYNGAAGRIVVNGGCLTAHALPSADPTGAGIAFGSDGELVLNGGEVSSPGFHKTSAHAVVTFNGGLIRATGTPSAGGFFVNFGDDDLRIAGGGLKFDTEDLTVQINQPLKGAGRLFKLGTGSLLLNGPSGHTGDTEIDEGSLILQSMDLSDFHTLRIHGSNARLRMEHGRVDRIARLVIDGAIQPAGIYQPAGSSGSGFPTDRLEGNGSLMAQYGPDDFLFSDWGDAHPEAAAFNEDHDGDGLPNGIEHVLGSDPNAPGAHPMRLIRVDSKTLALHHPLTPGMAADVARGYEWSRDLTDWHRGGESDSSGLTVNISEVVAGDAAEARFASASNMPDQLFVRLTATWPKPY